MAIKKIEQIKEGKWFRVWDLVAYGVIVVIIAALFLALFLSRDTSPADGIKISYNGTAVFTYDYASGKPEVLSESNIEIISDTDEKLTLIFYTAERKGHNTVVIDKVKKSVKVTEADCSTHMDCVYMPALTDKSSIISCTPHFMLIEPLVRDGNITVG